MSQERYLSYIQNLDLSPYPEWRGLDIQDHENGRCLGEILRKRNLLFTQWTNFDRKPYKLMYEQYICVLKGTEEFRVVSPIYRQNIYVGVSEKL